MWGGGVIEASWQETNARFLPLKVKTCFSVSITFRELEADVIISIINPLWRNQLKPRNNVSIDQVIEIIM